MDNSMGSFNEFLVSESAKIPIYNFIINFIIAGLLAYLLGIVFNKYGQSISNRKRFSSNLVLLTVTTMVVISIVKASLALSLGLVGALSIVRFRTAIKEPEELVFLFYAIAIGLGMGADQAAVVVVSFILLTIYIVIKYYKSNEVIQTSSIYLTIKYPDEDLTAFDTITNIIKSKCLNASLKRMDHENNLSETIFLVEASKFLDIKDIIKDIKDSFNKVSISLIDKDGLHE